MLNVKHNDTAVYANISVAKSLYLLICLLVYIDLLWVTIRNGMEWIK